MAGESDERGGLEGQTLADRYRVLERIGRGGMSEVYRAWHVHIERDVAVKVLRPELAADPEWNARFHREAMAAAGIDHPNIVDITDYGFLETGGAFIVMEHLQGESLQRVVGREGALPVRRCVAIARQILAALAAAHERGIVHRDLKADNVLLVQQGEEEQVKLLDFGISKVLRPEGDEGQLASLTATGVVMGTPHYISPEAIHGEKVDHRSDLYSLGVILYQMLAGRLPFEADTVVNLLFKQVQEQPLPPSQVRPDLHIPPALERVALRALEKEPEARFSSSSEMLAALPEAGMLEAGRPPPPARGVPWGVLTVAVTLALLGLGALASRWWLAGPGVAPSPDTGPPRVTAPRPADRGLAVDVRATVRLSVKAVPPGARVHLGDTLLGTGEVHHELPRGQEALELRITARGHRPRTMELVPDRDRSVEVTLQPLPRGPGRSREPVDLYKNPYRKR